MSRTDGLHKVAWQHAQTSKLLGVDFLPLQIGGPPGDKPPGDETPGDETPGDETPDVALAPRAPVLSTRPDKAQALAELRIRHDAGCPHCTCATFHSQTVFGEGDPNARLMFIGEAPGEEEDRTGRPFVGRAGQKLDEIIKAMGLSRPQVYIANVLKSRPPENRTPLQPEVDACAPFLAEQIKIIQPRVIVALGGPAAKLLLKTETGITRLRGQWGSYVDGELVIPIMPTFHPAYILRNYTLDTRHKVWSDMQAVLQKLAQSP